MTSIISHSPSPTTLLVALRESRGTAAPHAPTEVAPSVIIGPDADGQWRPLISQLRALMPHLPVLSDCKPEERSGPAVWLRCVIERALPDVLLPERAVPLIYLPNVSRQTLRSIEDRPESLLPLVELQYRGAVRCQRNGKDWSDRAFLMNRDGGLGLDVAEGQRTVQAMQAALPQPVDQHFAAAISDVKKLAKSRPALSNAKQPKQTKKGGTP